MPAYTFHGERYGVICGVLGSRESSTYPRGYACGSLFACGLVSGPVSFALTLKSIGGYLTIVILVDRKDWKNSHQTLETETAR
jgi:hypothetical protein